MFKFCLDGRMYIEGSDFPEIDLRHLYISATHPTHEGAQKIPIGGKEEKEVLRILKKWISQNVSDMKKEELLGAKTVIGLSEEELQQFRILELINRLEKR